MADIFTPVVQKILDLGAGNLFIFIFTFAVIYAILRKAKFLGESEIVNGILSFIAAFSVAFWFPLLTGTSLLLPMSILFTQAMSLLLFVLIGFVLASFFYPDMPKMLAEQFTKRTTLYVFLALGIVLFITSSLVSVIWSPFTKPTAPGSPPGPPSEVVLLGAGLIIFLIVLIVGAQVARSGGG
jgi:phosphoglycerol transferase MdoB-like AlkP superfamily enzyme